MKRRVQADNPLKFAARLPIYHMRHCRVILMRRARRCPGLFFIMLFCCQAQAYASLYARESICVMPFENFTSAPAVSDTVTASFARQLTRWTGAYVHHPQQVRRVLLDDERFSALRPIGERALTLARELDATLVLYGAVTEYDGFAPYALGVTVELVRAGTGEKLVSRNFFCSGFPVYKNQQKGENPIRTMREYVDYMVEEIIRIYF